MTATTGPVPKRQAERRRVNTTTESGVDMRVDRVDLQNFDGEVVEAPEPNPDWHPAALAVWNAACESGQRIFWEPSDWAVLALTCSQISQEYAEDLIIEKVKRPMYGGEGGGEELVYGSRPMPAGKFSAVMKVMSDLGMTEGGRRRIRIELERGERKGEDRKVSVAQQRRGHLTVAHPPAEDAG